MKLSGDAAVRFLENPDKSRAGILIYGRDAMRVALRRQQVIRALIGAEGENEMRLTRLSASDFRKDSASLMDAMKAQGFFPGNRVVFVQEAGDSAAKTIGSALGDHRQGDAMLVVTAGALAARSSLRKQFETHGNSVAIAIYDDPPSRVEIDAILGKAGIDSVEPDAMDDLVGMARDLDPGDFAQMAEKLGLYKLNDSSAVNAGDVAACAPATIEAALDEALHNVAEARVAEIGPMMQRLKGQGINPTSICIGASRHFRALHAAASHAKGAGAGLAATRPPVFGPRRDRMVRQSNALGLRKIETALGILTDTDLALRSARPAPGHAVMERAFIRIAMLAGKRS